MYPASTSFMQPSFPAGKLTRQYALRHSPAEILRRLQLLQVCFGRVDFSFLDMVNECWGVA